MADNDENIIFPFRNIDEDDFEDTINLSASKVQLENLCSKYEHFNFKNFDPAEYKTHEPGIEIDPESNFFNTIIDNCEYYTDEQFTGLKVEGNFSLIHFNSRSLNKNLKDIKDYLTKFEKFNVIAASETWLDKGKVEDAEMEGYKLFTTNRTNTVGGGVAIYVDTSFKCSMVKKNVYEC